MVHISASDYTSIIIAIVVTLVLSSSMIFAFAPPQTKFAGISRAFFSGAASTTGRNNGLDPQRPNISSASPTCLASNAHDNDNDNGMPQLPENVVKYSQVPKVGKVFTATTIPKGLLNAHTTKKGTWGIINVQKGKLEYKICAVEVRGNDSSSSNNGLVFELYSHHYGIIEPQRLHQVRPLSDDVEFVVEFLRVPGTGPVDENRGGL